MRTEGATRQQATSPAARTAVVWSALRAVLAERVAATGRARLDIVDAGGGTGGFAVPLAELGHTVTVVDPSPDSLAALERRAAEAGRGGAGPAGRRGRPGRAARRGQRRPGALPQRARVRRGSGRRARRVARLLRAGGVVSVLAANPVAAVLHRALAGQFDEAQRPCWPTRAGQLGRPRPDAAPLHRARRSPRCSPRPGSPSGEVHGVRVFADLVPSRLVDGEPGRAEALVALEQAAAAHPALRDIATQLHLLARAIGG